MNNKVDYGLLFKDYTPVVYESKDPQLNDESYVAQVTYKMYLESQKKLMIQKRRVKMMVNIFTISMVIFTSVGFYNLITTQLGFGRTGLDSLQAQETAVTRLPFRLMERPATYIGTTKDIMDEIPLFQFRARVYVEENYRGDFTIEDFTEFILEEERPSLGIFRITAYCLCVLCTEHYSADYPGNPLGFVQRTANGSIPVVGRTAAVDTTVIPFDTKFYVKGLGNRIAEDRGGAIRGYRIDLLKSSHQEALNWGVQYREVFKVNGED